MNQRWKVEQTSIGCYRVNMRAPDIHWSQSFLLSSDRHHDNAHSDWNWRLHLERRGA